MLFDAGQPCGLYRQSADLKLAGVHVGADEIERIYPLARLLPQAQIFQVTDNCICCWQYLGLLRTTQPSARRLSGSGPKRQGLPCRSCPPRRSPGSCGNDLIDRNSKSSQNC